MIRSVYWHSLLLWVMVEAGIGLLATAPSLQAAAPFGHYILGKRLAEDIRGGKVSAPPELVDALQDPDVLRYFCGGAVGPDLADTKTHHDDKPVTMSAGLMKYAQDHLAQAKQSGDSDKVKKAQQELAFAYGWLHHCAIDLAVHPQVNARIGDAFQYTSMVKQCMHGENETRLDAYVYKFLKKDGESYTDVAFPDDALLRVKLGLTQNEVNEGKKTLRGKVVATLILKNPEKLNLSRAEFQAKWEQKLKEGEEEAKKFVEQGKISGAWDLDCGHISTKDFKELRAEFIKLNGGTLPLAWGRKYLEWYEAVKNLTGKKREEKILELLGAIPFRVPSCLNDIDAKLNQALAAQGTAEAARMTLKKALGTVAAAMDAKKKLDAADNLPAEMSIADALIKNTIANDPRPVFEKLKELEQKADTAQSEACRYADSAARAENPQSAAAAAKQQAAIAAGAASETGATAKPIIDACKTIRDQLQTQNDLAKTILEAKEAAESLAEQFTRAEQALPGARKAAADIRQAKQTLETLETEIFHCAAEVKKELAPFVNNFPSLIDEINNADAAHTKCLELRQIVTGQSITADDDLSTAEGDVKLVKGRITKQPDYDSLSRQWLAMLEASRDYLAGGSAVEAWLVRIQKMADAAKECARRANNAEIIADTSGLDPALGGKIRVPSVLRMTQQAASALLKANHLAVQSKSVSSVSLTPETAMVNAQAPDAGTVVEGGTTVYLVVGEKEAAQPPVLVPNVVGLSAAQAYDQLAAVGLLAGSDFITAAPPAGKLGIVKTQIPSAGETCPRGNVVRLSIYGRVVPGIIGYWIKTAGFILNNAGLVINSVDYGKPPPRPDLEDCVYYQDPSGGASPPANKLVSVKVYGSYTGVVVSGSSAGALKIVKSYRTYEEYDDVNLEFKSAAMAAAGPNDHIYFKLYGAPKREGPWTLLSELGINGNFPITKERKDSERLRLDRDRLIFRFDLKEYLSAPTWFKVAQKTGSGSEAGEIMSEPLTPEPLAVIIEEIDRNRDSEYFEGIKNQPLKLTYEQLPSSDLFSLTVKLGQPDQNFVVKDIHVEARLKGQTRHQWGKEERLGLRLPLYGGSFPVEIIVDGPGGFRATRTITVEVTSPVLEKYTTRLAEIDMDYDKQEAREKKLNAEGLKKAQETLKNLEEKTPEGDKKYLNYRGDHAGQLIAIDHYSNPTDPYVTLISRCHEKVFVMEEALQWELALSLGLKETETSRLYYQASLAEQVRALDISRAHGIKVETPREKQCQVMKHHSNTKESDEYLGHLQYLLILTRQAGRYDLYASLAAEYVAARKWKSAVRREYVEIYSGYSAEEKRNEFKRLEKEYEEDVCKLFADLADTTANLTGDQELAASYYLSHLSKSAQLYAALSKKSQEQYIQDELRNPPLWWPKKPKKEIKPAELPTPPKSLKELSAAAPIEQTTAASPAAARTGTTTISNDFESGKNQPSSAKAMEAFKRGAAFAQAGRWGEAEPELREVVRLDPANGEYQLWLGNACGNLQKWDDAEHAYRECIRLTPLNPQGHSGLAWALAARGQWPECAAAYQEAIRLDPRNAIFHYYLGNTYNWQKKWAEAATAYQDAACLNPTNAAYHFALGQALGWQGKWSEAQAAYEETIKLDPKNAAVHDALGSSCYNQKQLAEAEAQYREAIKLNPAYGGFHANLAGVLLSQNRRDEALATAKEAIRLGCRQHWVYSQLGINP